MGVPKFFRYISERYPCLSEVVKDYQIPVFDNLYLDMNGIIHMCSHPDDADPHFRITEEKIFSDIFHYIEVLFCMIRPQKLFFMAIDGVAPRAKMNQQRARRFNSAKDAEKMEELARKKGETLPTEARFDSNCITPGTVFMARLQEQLKYFVVNKISTDKLWAQCTIILSGHNTPGEGEHKIMDYIRYLRSQKDYDPNTRHCLYGLDADLIMLGLCTHEPHFSLLREQVRFGKKSTKRKNIPEEITFYLLHLSLMREYLELEFASLKDLLEFGFDIEKIIDDWVLMGFLVGNDFIPNLPNMHIANGALPILYKTYMKVLPTLGGYINESGTLNLERFEKFMNELSSIDIDNFTEIYSDLKYFEQKTGRKFLEPFEESATKEEEVEIEEEICEPEVEASSDDEDESLLEEFRLHKRDYYVNKLEYANVTSDVLKDQAEGYVKAIQWNLNYYYNGCCSWSWYYPHHYAPYISDIKGFSNLKIEFEHGTPFKPYEQLLAVLPAASKTLLPNVYHDLMTEDSSPIKKYYPLEFKKDLNGKKQDWEAVVLVPFIDEEQLLKAMEPCNQLLTEEEVRRNSHGPMLVYSYTSESLGKYKAPEYFPDVGVNHADCQQLSVEDIKVPVEKLVKGLHPKAMLDVYFPGFPTFKHLKYEGSLEKARVSVFEQPSRGDNMIIKIIRDDQGKDPKSLLGNPVFVAWPHMVEAMVTCVSDENFRYKSIETPGHHHEEENKGDLKAVWLQQLEGITEHYKNRLGIDMGPTETLVEVRTMVGRRYMFTQHGRATLEKRWADIPSYYPLQTIVRDIPAHDDHHTTYVDLGSMFPVGSTCFMLGYPHHGASGVVLNDVESIRQGRIKVCIKSVPEPYLEDVKKLACKYEETYMPLMTAASRVALSRHVFSRITGTVFVVPKKQANESDSIRKANLGLNLKFNMKNQETPGYTRKIQGDWWYSEKTVQLVHDYMIVCPELFEFLNYNPKCSNVIQELVFPERSEERIKELLEWLKKQPASSVERQACGSQSLEPELVKRIEEIVDEDQKHPGAAKDVVLKIRPHLLYKPELQMGALLPDPSAIYKMLDRVVNVREGYTVPLGLKGTIVGIHKVPNEEDSYDIVFDKPFNGGLVLNGCSPGRGYKLSKLALINVSHGIRVYEEKTGKPGQLQKTLDAMQIKDKVKLRDNHSQLEILQRQHVKPGTSIQTAVLNQPPHSLPKQQQQFNPRANTNPVNPSHNRPVINTDTLRRMLKLDDKTSKEMENSHLRQVVPSDTRPMPSTYSMMLASFFHSQGMGWYPTYQYYKLQNNLFTAEVTLPNGSSIRGLPGVAKEQAAENAAKAALDFIKQHNVRTGFVNNPIPPPPMQWMHGQRYASPMLPQGRNNSVFVPLQAMRAPLVRNNATESRGNPPKQAENKPNASDRSPKVDNEKATASTSSQPQAKRRQRKQRLAMQLP